MNRAYDEPLEVTATAAAPPTRQAPKSKAIASHFAVSAYVSTFGVNDAGIEAAARRGACDTFEDFNVPTTNAIVSAVVAGLGKSRLNIYKEVTEFSQSSVTLLREANSSLNARWEEFPMCTLVQWQ